MAKNTAGSNVRVAKRTHTGTTGYYLMAVCPTCNHDNTLACVIKGEIHMRAAMRCQNPECGEIVLEMGKNVFKATQLPYGEEVKALLADPAALARDFGVDEAQDGDES